MTRYDPFDRDPGRDSDRDGDRDGDGLDETLRPTAELVRRVVGTGRMRPAFRDRLRRDLVAARAATIAGGTRAVPGGRARAGTRRPVPARRWRWRPAWAWAGAVAAAVAVGAVALGTPFTGQPGVPVSVATNLDGAVSAAPTAVVRLRFSRALDHAATLAALRLSPAARLSAGWDGETLTVRPAYGFAPDSAYVLTVDHTVARTATGARLAADLHVVFGTAPVAETPGGPGTAVQTLVRTRVAGAESGSEAVVTRDGSLLLTAAQPGPDAGTAGGLVRIGHGTAATVAAATDAICQSRSGQSVAYLSGTGGGTRIVFADAEGTAASSVPAEVDPGSPLGWINDAQVTFVGAGRLRAIDRTGKVITLSDTPVDAGQDTVAISPGGRYVFVGPASGGTGEMIDAQTNAHHALPGVTGGPAFSADGATVAWFDASHGAAVLDVAPSGGGPVLAVPLPVQPGDQLSDLALSPDGYHVVYSVTAPNGDAQLRLAALPDGRTLAVSGGATGQSPNWSASGRLFTVFTGDQAGGHIDTVAVPDTGRVTGADWGAIASAFARAEVGGDLGALRTLAAPDTILPTLPPVSRATVLWVQPSGGGTATARVRLTIDPTPDDPVVRQADETLTMGTRAGAQLAVVRAVSVGDFRPAPAGPHLTGVDTTSPGTARLTFDADLDPGAVPTAVELLGPDGRTVPSAVRYDPAIRTVTVAPAAGTDGSATLRIGTGLRDVDGHGPSAPLDIPVRLTP